MWTCDPSLSTTVATSYNAVGPVFVQALTSFFAAHCALAGDHQWPEDAINSVLEDPNYDFIVVGAGSAGSVVANRLSEVADWKVLLVEAGGNPSLASQIPQVFYNNLGGPDDWGYKTQPQDGACRSYKSKGCAWPRGKTLGGSSAINGMFYVRANKADYDDWAADGNYGWSYEEVLPYFKKSENFMGDITDNDKYHSKNGYLHVAEDKNWDPVEEFIIKAYSEIGVKNVSDVTGDNQMGITRTLTTIKDGVRVSTAAAFLKPVKHRSNLHILKNTFATKIVFKENSNVVSGISLQKDGKDFVVNIRKELIISGGSINTPQLLMLSGIGPQHHLEELGIEVKADLPVGENLQDHIFVPIMYNAPGDSTRDMSVIVKLFADYIMAGTGPFADTSPHKLIAFVNTTDPASTSPDVQFHNVVFPPHITNLVDVFERHGFNEDIVNQFRAINNNKTTIFVYNTLLKTKTKGKILLKSKNPFEHPLIHANYFDDPDDIKTIIRAMRQYSLKIGETKTFKEAGFKLEWLELETCKNYEKTSDEFLDCVCRELTFSLYHPTSSVKMGPDSDPSAVVDPELRVRKVQNLRVIDASIMPFVVRGNTNAPTIMIGEKGADLVKNYWLEVLKHTEL